MCTSKQAIAFAEQANNLRIVNKNNLVILRKRVGTHIVQYQAFNCYIRELVIDGVSHATSLTLKATNFKSFIIQELSI